MRSLFVDIYVVEKKRNWFNLMIHTRTQNKNSKMKEKYSECAATLQLMLSGGNILKNLSVFKSCRRSCPATVMALSYIDVRRVVCMCVIYHCFAHLKCGRKAVTNRLKSAHYFVFYLIYRIGCGNLKKKKKPIKTQTEHAMIGALTRYLCHHTIFLA